MSMIDRIALAIWQAQEANFPERVKRLTPDNIDRATGAWARAQALARAAVEAMREPTDEMVEAAEFWHPDGAGDDYTRPVYRRMIDAVLTPPGGTP